MHSFFEQIAAKIPLIQAPMAGAQDEKLAIAVAGEGAVGSIACARLKPDELLASAQKFQSQASGPLNLNFFCHDVVLRDPSREVLWHQELNRYYNEFSLPQTYPETVPVHALDERMVEVVCRLKPAIVSFHFGLPDKTYVDRIRATGSKIIASATTLEEAIYLEAQGCDAVIAQGREAGGHQGVFLQPDQDVRFSTTELIEQMVSVLRIPIIAAGGIADANLIRKMMNLGAAGVQVGTRFLKSPESTITSTHRAILEGEEIRKTAITNVFTGRPARGFVNRIMKDVGPMNPHAQVFPFASSALAPIATATKGSEDFVSLWAGQNWQIGDHMRASEIVKELSQGFTG
ncbi:MAG: nitronate monooxygenase [Aliishimia sp.]